MQISQQQIILYLVVGTIVLLLVGFFITILVLLYNKRYKMHIMEKSYLQSQFTQTLLQTQLEIQEQTLHTVAQEIHDNTGQLLSLIKLNIATTNVEKPDQAKEKLHDTLGLVSQVITGIRQLSHTLDTGFVERQGLGQAITHQLQLVEKTGALQTHLQVVGEEVRFDKQQELILFRMVQETLNNIIKHAQATNIQVHIEYKSPVFSIIISDNGIGFDTTAKAEGMGLQNMHNRAKMIGATLTINSEPGKGTITSISLPLHISHQLA